MSTNCPTCTSHSPELHPAMQEGGEVQPCPDPWHATARIPVGFERGADGVLRRGGSDAH